MKKKIINEIRKFNKERNWDRNLDPQDIAKSVVIEAAELLEHFQWDGTHSQRKKPTKKDKIAIGEEIADVFIYLIRLCYEMGFDIEAIILDKLKKNTKKYPIKKSK